MALRATELCQLQVGDVLSSTGKVNTYVTIRPETAKRKKERTIRIGEFARLALETFLSDKRRAGESLDPAAPLFVSQKGGHLDRTHLFRIVSRTMKQAGIRASVHALRKTGATIYYMESDYDLIATQQFLGHADPSTTRKYIGLDTAKLVAYSENLSDYLRRAISGEKQKDNTNGDLLHFSDSDLLIELQHRGYDINSLLHQKRPQEVKQAHVLSIDTLRGR